MVHHWLWFDGEEVGNATRTNTYLRRFHPSVEIEDMCESCGSCSSLSNAIGRSMTVSDGVITWSSDTVTATEQVGGTLLLEEEDFFSPLADPAPWYSSFAPETAGFYGFLPLRVSGLADSTRSATVNQSIVDGGSVNGFRNATKEVRITGALVARDAAGIEAGMAWLDSRLEAGREDGCRNGVTLSWYQSCPRQGQDPQEYERELRDARVVSGPSVVSEQENCNLHIRTVDFTIVSEKPYIHGPEIPQVVFTGGAHEVRRTGVSVTDESWMKATCSAGSLEVVPIHDPTNPLPPPPPFVDGGGSTPSRAYNHHTVVTLPQGMAPEWGQASPRIRIQPRSGSVRDVRVRIIEATTPSMTPQTTDPCALTGEFFISYIPSGHYVDVDASTRRISGGLVSTGEPRSASHLVHSSIDGKFFEYPTINGKNRHIIYVDSSAPVGVSVHVSTRHQ